MSPPPQLVFAVDPAECGKHTKLSFVWPDLTGRIQSPTPKRHSARVTLPACTRSPGASDEALSWQPVRSDTCNASRESYQECKKATRVDKTLLTRSTKSGGMRTPLKCSYPKRKDVHRGLHSRHACLEIRVGEGREGVARTAPQARRSSARSHSRSSFRDMQGRRRRSCLLLSACLRYGRREALCRPPIARHRADARFSQPSIGPPDSRLSSCRAAVRCLRGSNIIRATDRGGLIIEKVVLTPSFLSTPHLFFRPFLAAVRFCPLALTISVVLGFERRLILSQPSWST